MAGERVALRTLYFSTGRRSLKRTFPALPVPLDRSRLSAGRAPDCAESGGAVGRPRRGGLAAAGTGRRADDAGRELGDGRGVQRTGADGAGHGGRRRRHGVLRRRLHQARRARRGGQCHPVAPGGDRRYHRSAHELEPPPRQDGVGHGPPRRPSEGLRGRRLQTQLRPLGVEAGRNRSRDGRRRPHLPPGGQRPRPRPVPRRYPARRRRRPGGPGLRLRPARSATTCRPSMPPTGC